MYHMEAINICTGCKTQKDAAAKEKELLKNQESLNREKKSSYDSYLKALLFLKVFFYFVLVCWYWSSPVAAISKQLVQPFGKVLSWRSGVSSNDNVMSNLISAGVTYLSSSWGWGNGLHHVSGNHKQQNNLIDAQTSCQELDLLYDLPLDFTASTCLRSGCPFKEYHKSICTTDKSYEERCTAYCFAAARCWNYSMADIVYQSKQIHLPKSPQLKERGI
ncbi:hypothetical protein CK203_033404 [Vitis vinifera]|uniref:Uncharacterized protein n=1 Tax=Vitis vinifera TaxID=29760 RepID=A0A438HMK5_VITVI|nr:hypothetical protein CK203_033404 [Vitis vinifera]